MKNLLFPILLLCFSTCIIADDPKPEKTSITPKFSEKFGQVIEVTVTFVEKPRTYYAQNLVKADCYAKVLAVNGEKLAEPVIIEYRCVDVDFEKGSTHTLTAYEDLESRGVDREWDGKIRQHDYFLLHFIWLRNPALPKAKQPYKMF